MRLGSIIPVQRNDRLRKGPGWLRCLQGSLLYALTLPAVTRAAAPAAKARRARRVLEAVERVVTTWPCAGVRSVLRLGLC